MFFICCSLIFQIWLLRIISWNSTARNAVVFVNFFITINVLKTEVIQISQYHIFNWKRKKHPNRKFIFDFEHHQYSDFRKGLIKIQDFKQYSLFFLISFKWSKEEKTIQICINIMSYDEPAHLFKSIQKFLGTFFLMVTSWKIKCFAGCFIFIIFCS